MKLHDSSDSTSKLDRFLARSNADPKAASAQAFGPEPSDATPRVLVTVGDLRAEPSVRGEWLLKRLERAFSLLTRLTSSAVHPALDPFRQTAAVADLLFIIATISGVLLLFWYSPSVDGAYSSTAAMSIASGAWFSGCIRSVHRYSSDACVLFVVLHALQVFSARRFTGSRWLAWVSGLVLLGLLWLDGWLGYWLAWDERGKQVAKASAALVDVLPIFSDPLSRGFLTERGIESLLFFIVFFMHMLIPFGIGVALWIHICRLNRPAFLPTRRLSVLVTIVLVGLSVLVPATSAERAQMDVITRSTPIDWFFMAPVVLLNHMSVAAVWIGGLIIGAVLASLPFLLVRRRPAVSQIVDSRCSGCAQCFEDCPYEAISMVPSAGKPKPIAEVDPARCVGCGICVGSCERAAVVFGREPVTSVYSKLDGWLKSAAAEGERPAVAFLCAESAARSIHVDVDTGRSPELPGYRVLTVPCSGWVPPVMAHRVLRNGACGVLISGCNPGEAFYRLGGEWTRLRMAGTRHPGSRAPMDDEAVRERIRYVAFNPAATGDLISEAGLFYTRLTSGGSMDAFKNPLWQRLRSRLIQGGVVALLCVVVWALSSIDVPLAGSDNPVLVVSFKHPGAIIEAAEAESDDSDRLPHMRGAAGTRRTRAPVRMQIWIDGELVREHEYPPHGLFGDGSSVAIERILLTAGRHQVRVRINDTANPDVWPHVEERDAQFSANRIKVIQFDRVSGFVWD